MTTKTKWTMNFSEIGLADLNQVGGKNASLGELYNQLRPLGINVPDGFATTAEAYRLLLGQNDLRERLQTVLSDFEPENVEELARRGSAARAAILETPLPAQLRDAILEAYQQLCHRLGRNQEPELAVRSSATAEDLPQASFAGAQETFLNVRGIPALLHAVQACYASLFTDRAISYRAQLHSDQLEVALSIGIMPMVRSDKASSGVIFTLDTETGFWDAVIISSSYGLGEFVVKGAVTPDEWVVFKPTLQKGFRPIIGRQLGSKEVRLVFGGATGTAATRSEPTPLADRQRFSLGDNEVLQLAHWACQIEEHYSQRAGHPQPMDIEWAKDGQSGELFVVQARPETVHSAKPQGAASLIYRLKVTPPPPILTGQAVGEKIGQGRARVIKELAQLPTVQAGEVLVAEKTDPDWEPVMKRVAAIVTEEGGRTAHAAIVSRELGLPCIVGTQTATKVIEDGQDITVCCAEGPVGNIYAGRLPYEVERLDVATLPTTHTKIMMNIGDPGQAFACSFLPNAGVGLARLEFIINNHIGIHPMALARYPMLQDQKAVREIKERLGDEEPREFFIRRLAEGVGRIAAAFYPKPVIVRTSDFKTNEYARLLGGAEFEPAEENPMLGFRGASRYYDPRYAPGFALECAALLRVRQEMGLTNVKVMIPFCRTVEEARRVIETMADNGLRQGQDGLEIYAMCEIPSNVVLAPEFLRVFDGFSIGSNDLTQLTLGLDRDSGTVAHLFDENNEAVRKLIVQAIEAAQHAGKPIGICGQAPSDYPHFARWLVECGITSLSLNPDTVVKTSLVVADVETKKFTAPVHIK